MNIVLSKKIIRMFASKDITIVWNVMRILIVTLISRKEFVITTMNVLNVMLQKIAELSTKLV